MSSYLPRNRGNEKLKPTAEDEENFKKNVYPYTNRVDTEKELSNLELKGYDTTELRAWAAKMRGNIDMTPEQAKQVADHRITIGLDKPSFADQVKNVWNNHLSPYFDKIGSYVKEHIQTKPVITFNNEYFEYKGKEDNPEKLYILTQKLKQLTEELFQQNISAGSDIQEAKGYQILYLAKSIEQNIKSYYYNGGQYNHSMKEGDYNDISKDFRINMSTVVNGKIGIDCSGFVDFILSMAGIGEAERKASYGYLVNGPSNGPPNILFRNNIFEKVPDNEVRLGDFALTTLIEGGKNDHIMIVSEVKNGQAVKYIHSTGYDYNGTGKSQPGIIESPFVEKIKVHTLTYYRVRKDYLQEVYKLK